MSIRCLSGAPALLFSGACAEIHAAAFSPTGARAWSRDEIEALLHRDTTLLLFADHAFLLLEIIGSEAEVLTIAVDPRHQRQGLGRECLSTLIKLCVDREVIRCILEVATDNCAAIALYDAFDFRQIATRPRYFKRNNGSVDALLMEKSL